MTRTIVTSVVFIFLLSCSVKVKTGDAEKLKIDKICDAIMQAFKDENVDAAMSLMKKHSIIKDAAIDTLHATIVEQKPYFTRWANQFLSSWHKRKSLVIFWRNVIIFCAMKNTIISFYYPFIKLPEVGALLN